MTGYRSTPNSPKWGMGCMPASSHMQLARLKKEDFRWIFKMHSYLRSWATFRQLHSRNSAGTKATYSEFGVWFGVSEYDSEFRNRVVYFDSDAAWLSHIASLSQDARRNSGACTCTAAPRRRCAQTPCTERAARMCLGKRRRSGSATSIPIVFARGTRRPLHFFSLRRQTREAFSSREPGLYHLPCHTKLSGRISSCSCSSKGVTGLQQKQPPRAAHILTHMVSHTITTMN